MNVFKTTVKTMSIRSYVAVDRFDRLSENLYMLLQGIPLQHHSILNFIGNL